MLPSSLQTIPTQPNAPSYPVSAISLGVTTYEAYAAANGLPPWDPTWPEQYWYDSTASTGLGDVYAYITVGTDASGNPIIQLKMIPASRARTVNIPVPSGLVTLGVLTPPCRPLLADEILQLVADKPIPGVSTPMVIRTDEPQPPVPVQYNASDSAIIQRMGAYLTSIGK